ncbi:MAG: exodeoxyribonuclease VII large subunit [Chloroflexota bacterium]|nr:MAG: exodeoxyribonuclease VII large subunit [Chloroflexota bacterium]
MARPDPDPHAPHPWQAWLTERAPDPDGPELVPYEESGSAGPAHPGATDPTQPLPWSPPARPRIRTVGELTRIVRDRLRGAPELRDVWVEGEVGQVSISAAGHAYFTIRDGRAQLACVLFRDERQRINFDPRTGLRIVAHGRVDVFEGQGTYQLYVDSLQPAGQGDLALRLEQLKARLAAEGLFDPGHKRPLPARPQVIGLVTSAEGAVLHDIRKVLSRRWPLVRVILSPCRVQGEGAPESILRALGRLAAWRDPATGRAVDLAIVARGGGSLEDLWAFNDERIVRRVAAYPVPVVAGVGHETDVTLVEFAADVRAATPSVAAELVVPDRVEVLAGLAGLRTRTTAATVAALAQERRDLEAERRALARLHPQAILDAERERAGQLLDRAVRALTSRLTADRARLTRASDRLPGLVGGRLDQAGADLRAALAGVQALSPYATLERGYAIVRRLDGTVVRSAAAQAVGDPLEVRLGHGALDVRVARVRDSAP